MNKYTKLALRIVTIVIVAQLSYYSALATLKIPVVGSLFSLEISNDFRISFTYSLFILIAISTLYAILFLLIAENTFLKNRNKKRN